MDVARSRTRLRANVHLIEVDVPRGDDTCGVADRDQIERGFSRLRPEQRAVVVLRYYLGLSLPEVSQTLHIPLGTAKSRLHYAMEIAARSGRGGRSAGCLPGGETGMSDSDPAMPHGGLEERVGAWLESESGAEVPDWLLAAVFAQTRELPQQRGARQRLARLADRLASVWRLDDGRGSHLPWRRGSSWPPSWWSRCPRFRDSPSRSSFSPRRHPLRASGPRSPSRRPWSK